MAALGRRRSSFPPSKGRSSTRIGAATLADGTLVLAWSTDNRVETMYHRPLRQQVFMGVTAAPPMAVTANLTDPRQPEGQPAKPAHPNEAADLKAIRAYPPTSMVSRCTSCAAIFIATPS